MGLSISFPAPSYLAAEAPPDLDTWKCRPHIPFLPIPLSEFPSSTFLCTKGGSLARSQNAGHVVCLTRHGVILRQAPPFNESSGRSPP